jgi:hypothetical protein
MAITRALKKGEAAKIGCLRIPGGVTHIAATASGFIGAAIGRLSPSRNPEMGFVRSSD